MPKTVIGILAHVDAGKTTLSEALLYCAGDIRKLGRVDHGDAFLDTFALERQRGITIFSKEARLSLGSKSATLLDTPGHVDFSAETERTLDVLDCAILVISAPEGVQSHTRTLWKLLRDRDIPTLLFINKMDLPGADRAGILAELTERLGDGFFVPGEADPEVLALCDEALLEEHLERGELSGEALDGAFRRGHVYPCFFGAALKLEGVEAFLKGLERFAPAAPAQAAFAARVFKISRDEDGKRLTHMKITGGILRVRDTVTGPDWEEKVTQLRFYSGAKFTPADRAEPGDIVAVTGLSATFAGQGLGAEGDGRAPALEPVMSYAVYLPAGCDVHKTVAQLRELEEENPELKLVWEPRTQSLHAQIMGQVQLEIVRQLVHDRFGFEIAFGPGSILYRETIAGKVEGVGHYEPLRHYAEVHLILEPGERGSGVEIRSAVPEDALAGSWQRLILTHLHEKQHLGVLTGSPVTDIKITLSAGRAHIKHTEGGDFREATYRAVRQGLMSAKSVLLEPWYDFRMELPQGSVGRAMTDLQRMGARFEQSGEEAGMAVLTGSGPVARLREYPAELTVYTRGQGRVSFVFHGYEPCAEQDAVVEAIGYDPLADLDNSPDSVFCAHGAGFVVKWDQVQEYMHLDSGYGKSRSPGILSRNLAADDKALEAIMEREFGPIKRPAYRAPDTRPATEEVVIRAPRDRCLIVDGYNVLFQWESLRSTAQEDLETARRRLMDALSSYAGFRKLRLILVFDGYKVKGNPGEKERYHNIQVVYTKENETADAYIEALAAQLGGSYAVSVATSDALVQLSSLRAGVLRTSARELEAEVEAAHREMEKHFKK